MLSYESFFLIVIISVLGPVVGVLGLLFYNEFEKQIYLLEIEKKEILLEKELETRRYLQLHQQIQPHFLFNALNSMFSLIRLEKYKELSKAFEHMVLYLRSLYTVKQEPLTLLKEEIEYTNHYLEIQKLRFGDRLSVSWKVDSRLLDAYIIQYMLQTFVENAFKHGFDKVEEELILQIKIRFKDEGQIELTVIDNGPGFKVNPLSQAEVDGQGLVNLKRQLNYIYGNDAKINIRIRNQHENGGEISAVWPIRFQ